MQLGIRGAAALAGRWPSQGDADEILPHAATRIGAGDDRDEHGVLAGENA
jgi:hypothetical protein